MTEAEFNEWRTHPVTLAIIGILERKREELRRQWESGSFTDYEAGAMALTNVANIGTCRGYAYVQELEYEQFIGELDV
jgi:hypothetical protein